MADLDIHSITIDSHRAEFVHQDALSNLTISNPQDVHNHPELKRKIYSALAEDDEGELSIAMPPEVHVRKMAADTASLDLASAGTSYTFPHDMYALLTMRSRHS